LTHDTSPGPNYLILISKTFKTQLDIVLEDVLCPNAGFSKSEISLTSPSYALDISFQSTATYKFSLFCFWQD